MNEGYIYILSNAAMPGLLKVGYSKNGGASRMRQLYTTGVPHHFTLEFEIFSKHAHASEKEVHDRLEEYRVCDNREFFEVPVEIAIQETLNVVLSDYDIQSGRPEEWEAFEAARMYANQLDEHPFVVASALRFLTTEQVKEAVRKHLFNVKKLVTGFSKPRT